MSKGSQCATHTHNSLWVLVKFWSHNLCMYGITSLILHIILCQGESVKNGDILHSWWLWWACIWTMNPKGSQCAYLNPNLSLHQEVQWIEKIKLFNTLISKRVTFEANSLEWKDLVQGSSTCFWTCQGLDRGSQTLRLEIGHHKDILYNEIEPYAHSISSTPNSMCTTTGITCGTVWRERVFATSTFL